MGKAAIILVIGFSLVLAVTVPNIKRQTDLAYENYLTYVSRTQVHNLAVSAANMAANQLFVNNAWTAGYSDVSFGNGTYDAVISDVAPNRKKITTYGHINNAMLNGVMQKVNDTVEVLLQPSSFSKFAVYINNMSGVAWATGDTVWGPCHIEGTMNLAGKPVFYGKVTTKNGTNPATLPTATVKPQFYGGYKSGVSVPLPTSLAALTTAATSGGKVFSPPGSPAGTYEVQMVLNSDGTVTYKEFKGATQVGSTVTTNLTSLTGNGAILVSGGNLRVKGTLHGQVTIGATGSSGTGNVYINGDIRYATDPTTNPSSDDYLGLVADNNIKIPLPASGPIPHDYMIQASLFSRTGTFSADQTGGMGVLGAVTVYGSMTSYGVGSFATGDASGNVINGYSNKFRFDDRLLVGAPPYFPTTGLYEVLSWKE